MVAYRVIGCAAGLAAFGLAGCGEEAPGAEQVATAVVTSPVAASDSHAEARNRFNWQMNCQGCHGPDGAGNIARDVPRLAALETFQRLPEGREFLIRVPGMSRSPLSDEELTEMANWMMDEFATPGVRHDWQPYTTAEVSALRSRPIVDGIVQHRAKLIASIEKRGS